jgi:hypothetical protein
MRQLRLNPWLEAFEHLGAVEVEDMLEAGACTRLLWQSASKFYEQKLKQKAWTHHRLGFESERFDPGL